MGYDSLLIGRCETGATMPTEQYEADEALSLELVRRIDALCDEFEAALRQGADVAIESYVNRVTDAGRSRLIKELAFLALTRLRAIRVLDPLDALLAANPGLRNELAELPPGLDRTQDACATTGHSSTDKGSGLVIRCPYCHSPIELLADASLIAIDCAACGGSFSLVNNSECTREAATLTNVAHFELVERLGMGEFGTVWKARDTLLDRTVAIKIPRREQLDAVSIEKFMREARTAAQLRHRNIVSTHEVGRAGDTLYIVSDYIRGVTLSEVITDHRVGIRDSVVMAAKIADALDHAHRLGVVHRDLKPSNILVDDNGEPNLMDFGLAKRKEREITITTEGAILGTPAYMSPEQARGEGSHVDGRSDIYSLGVVLFQMLTGELPFRGSIRMLLQKVINDDPPAPRTLDGRVPKDLDTICLKCLEKEPARRYATAGELAADLRRFLAGEPVVARRLGALGRAVRWTKRNRAVAFLLAATIFTLLTATVVSSYFGWRAAESAARTDQQALAVTNTLYDSLLQELRLTRQVRQQGYGATVRELVDRARKLPTSRVDLNELRRQMVLSMGDFVAYPPSVIGPLAGPVTAICLSGDGREIVLGLDDGRVFTHDVLTGKPRDELESLVGSALSITVDASDAQLIAADRKGNVRVWQRTGRKWAAKQKMHTGEAADALHCSPDGAYIAYLKDAVLEIWNVSDGLKLHSLPTESGWAMRNVAINSATRRVVGAYRIGAADEVGWAVWDLDTGKRLHDHQMPSLGNTYVNGIDISKEGARFAIGFDEELLVYEMPGYEKTKLPGFDSIKAVAFSPTSPYLAAANIRGWIALRNSITNRELATLNHPRRRMSQDDLSFSSDGTHLAASNAESVRVWRLNRAAEKTVMEGHAGGIPCAAFHPNSRLLATGGKDSEVRFWDPSTGHLKGATEVGEPVQTLAFSADGGLLAVGCMGSTGAPHLKFIDMASREIVFESKPAMGHVHSLVWAETTDGRFLAGCGEDGVALWSVPKGSPFQVEAIIELDRKWCLATVIDPAARYMIWTEEDWRLKAWDIVAGQEKLLHAPPMLQGWHGLAYLPKEKSIIYVTKSGEAEVWNIDEDRRVNTIGKPGAFNAPHIALSPDGKWFAALTQPDTVSVWHRPTGEHIFSLRPEAGTVWSLAWDKAGEQLAVGQSDGGLVVWHLPEIQRKLAESGLDWHLEP